jgi:hypothetical protein
MARTSEVVAGVTIGAFLGLAAGLALTPGPADAGYGIEKPQPQHVSNTEGKSDMFVTGEPLAVSRKALPKAVEVAQVQKVGDDFILLDAKGRIVYRSERNARTTTVAKGADVPLITGYGVAVGRVDAAFQQVGN